jgi:hypothetical protein
MIIQKPCVVCTVPTRNIEENRLDSDGVPMMVYLCTTCVELMRNERMNEIWSFNDSGM